MPVIGASGGDPFLIAWLDVWSMPVRLDPKWKGGAYAEDDPPIAGLTAALQIVTLHAQQRDWARSTFGAVEAELGRDPALSIHNRFKIEMAVRDFAAARAALSDANNFLYLVRANQLAAANAARIKAPTLLVYSPTDLVFPLPLMERTAAQLREVGTIVETLALHGPNGHLNGILQIEQAGPAIAEFITRD